MYKIAIDAMGGDQAPLSVVEGALLASAEGVSCVLVGDKPKLEKIINKRQNLKIYH